MNYVFFGSPRFATIVLIRLMDAGLMPAALVCNPDRPAGRKQIMTAPPTKDLMLGRMQTAPILQPEKLTSSFAAELKVLNPDFFIVAAYGAIIPEAVLEIPKFGTLGTHPSLLPKYRGASPIQSALLDGEATTGTSIYLMDDKVDHGPILAQASLTVSAGENYESLEARLGTLSGGLLADVLANFSAGTMKPKPQDEAQATYTKKFDTQDAFIDNNDLQKAQTGDVAVGTTIYRKIKALNPEPGCWTMQGGKRIKLLEASMTNGVFNLITIQEEGGLPKKV